MIFQRWGRPNTLIHRCVIPTSTKKTSHNERKAINLSHRTAHPLPTQAESAQILVAEFHNVEQNQKIGGAELAIEGGRTAHDRAKPQVAFYQAGQLQEYTVFVIKFAIAAHTFEATRYYRLNPKSFLGVIALSEQ